jgi:DNA-binding beta-propeller fold protein YncE
MMVLASMLAGMAAVAGWILLAGDATEEELHRSSEILNRYATGSPQLVSSTLMPPVDGQMCEWTPASASFGLVSAFAQERQVTRTAQPTAGSTLDLSQRKPARMIRDPYAAYSSVAVDPVHNEVVLTDENLFQILVYDRMANTPPAARMTEPKRVIGGLSTKIEFQCGLYIDPSSGDIYAVNNDTVNTLVIFNREAKGNVPPTRELRTPHGSFGIAVDEEAQEMFLTTQHDHSVVVFRKHAQNQDAPIRLLQGNRTGLADPHGIALDVKNQVMFVSNHGGFHEKQVSGEMASGGENKPNWPVTAEVPGSGRFLSPSITVYPLKAAGDVSPLRVMQGPNTQMNLPAHLAFDEERQELYVANDMGDSVLVFSATAEGDAAPIRVLKGPITLIKNPTGVFLDSKNDELWVANFGNHTTTVYRRGASGNVAPLRTIRSGPFDEPTPGIGNPHPIAYDSKREEILVPN